jgi:hypothetical protein
MTRAIVNQIPSDSLVFEKIVKSWCITSVKRKKERNSRCFSPRSTGRIGDQQQHFEIYIISLQGIHQPYNFFMQLACYKVNVALLQQYHLIKLEHLSVLSLPRMMISVTPVM